MINGVLSTSGAKIQNLSDWISLKSLDYSENRINTKMSDINSFLWSETYTSLLAINFNDDWWAKKIKAKQMLDLFEISSGNENDIYKALLFCYSHQGSTKGIVKLCLALFGKNAHIEFILHTNKLDIITDIDNLNFLKALTTNNKLWLTTYNNRGLIAETFEKLGTSQLTLFLQGFMHPSKQISLTIQQNNE